MMRYEELVKRCSLESVNAAARAPMSVTDNELVDISTMAILTEVLRTLETVTPEMRSAWRSALYSSIDKPDADADWLAMLRASPLAPPKDKP